jgi:uncharacterized protein involved in exopolysaccharide biosynthesis
MTIYEDEFDLYPYIVTLLKNWKFIVFLAFIAALAALVFSLLQPRTYSATSTIIGTYQRPVLTLSEEFSTVSNNGNANNKHQAFVTIAAGGETAQTVYEQFKDQLPADMSLKNFRKSVEVTDQGDAILITASFEDPALSAEIANTWASVTVQAINSTYGESQPLGPIQTQIIESRANYLTTQDALEAFIENNQIAALERSIAEAQQVLDILQSAKLGIIDTHLNAQVDLITDQANQYFEALSTHTQMVFSSQVEEQINLLTFYASRKTELETLLVQAEALKEQLSSGNRSVAGDSGDALALFLSRAQTFGIESEITLDISVVDVNNLQDLSTNYVSDIDRMIEQINDEMGKTDVKLQELSELLASGGDYQYFELPDAENHLFQAGMESLDNLVMMDLPTSLMHDYTGTPLENQILEISSEIQGLQAQLESEQATQRDLTNDRDLAEKAYQALLVKETEIKAGSQTSNEVTLASSAIVNTDPDSRGTITNTLLAGIVGGMLAVVWVFVSTWWKNQSENSIDGTETT